MFKIFLGQHRDGLLNLDKGPHSFVLQTTLKSLALGNMVGSSCFAELASMVLGEFLPGPRLVAPEL
jgi:hypothetical protein